MYEISSPHIVNLDYSTNRFDVPKITSEVSYSEFFEKFLLKNKPCIISNISNEWPASNKWIKKGSPNFSVLYEKYGDMDICVSDCKERYFNAQKTETLSFGKYIEYWENYIKNNYCHELPLLYLKDWHLRRKTNENFYTIPIFFASDWLNEYFSEKNDDDYMFVYMGPKGTWTPFHVDVFTSFSWSTNICGQKKWLLFPPGEEISLKDSLGNLPYDVTQCEINNKCVELIQNAGEAIYVPSGWHHQVLNVEDTISINHNWVNGCNIRNMWMSIVENLKAVKKEINDCKDMDGWLNHCQIMLKTSHGIDFKMFYDFLFYIANKRIDMLQNNVICKHFSTWEMGENHAVFDLVRISEVLKLFMNHKDFGTINFTNESTKITPQDLFRNMEDILIKYD